MELQLSLVILCSFLLQESSAGLGLPSSIASLLLPIKVEATNLSLFGGRNRFLFQLKVSHPKAFHDQLPLHNPSTRDSHTSPSPLSAHHNHHLRKKFHHGRQNVLSPSPSPSRSPTVSPMSSPAVSNKKYLPPLPSMALPPPPPNQGCASVTCTEPLTYTPPGKSCACVWPIQVRL